MYIKEISPIVFERFAVDHPYHNFHQSLNYALLKSEEGYDYEFIALFDNETIMAACLVLGKKINGKPYGYIPDSFLIDYNNKELLKIFTNVSSTTSITYPESNCDRITDNWVLDCIS